MRALWKDKKAFERDCEKVGKYTHTTKEWLEELKWLEGRLKIHLENCIQRENKRKK